MYDYLHRGEHYELYTRYPIVYKIYFSYSKSHQIAIDSSENFLRDT